MPFKLDGIPLAKELVDRASETETLQKHLLPSRQRKRCAVVVANGLGGISKTQLSVEFIRRHHRRFSAVVWLDARNEDSVKRGLAVFVSKIPKDRVVEPRRTSTHDSIEDVDVAVREALEWLAISDNTSWLLIFDNVDHETDLASSKTPQILK